MKKFGFSAIVSLLICITITLAACGSQGFGSFYSDKFEETKTITSVETLTGFGEYVDGAGSIAIFEKTESANTVYTVYDFNQKKTIGTYPFSSVYDVDVEAEAYLGNGIYAFEIENKTTGVKTTDYCGSNGEKAFTVKDGDTVKYLFDVIIVNGAAYRMGEDGVFTFAFNADPMAEYDYSIDCKIGDYYFDQDSDSTMVLDKEFNVKGYVSIPTYAEYGSSKMIPLSNGNVLVQYLVEEPYDASDYDFIQGGDKYTLETKLFNAESGEYKNLDFDYLLYGSYGIANGTIYFDNSEYEYVKIDFADFGVSSDIDNLIYGAIEITDKRIDMSSEAAVTLSLSNSGKVEKVLEKTVVGQTGMPTKVCANRYVVYSSKIGERYLLNEKGEKIGAISDSAYMLEGFIVVDDDCVYDYDLNKVVKLGSSDYAFVDSVGSSLILSKEVDTETKYYLLKKGETAMVEISGYKGTVSDTVYYVENVSETATTYTYYNAKGESLITVSSRIILKQEDENGNFLGCTVSTDSETSTTVYTYYRFA